MDHSNEVSQFNQQIWEFQSYAHFKQFRDALQADVDAGRMTEPRFVFERACQSCLAVRL